jgi:hypothetical protein
LGTILAGKTGNFPRADLLNATMLFTIVEGIAVVDDDSTGGKSGAFTKWWRIGRESDRLA